MNHDFNSMVHVVRPLYRSAGGAVGQDPRESGTQYKIRMQAMQAEKPTPKSLLQVSPIRLAPPQLQSLCLFPQAGLNPSIRLLNVSMFLDFEVL